MPDITRKPTMSPIPSAKSQIFTVASGKGGVGKTWFAITLASCMAAAGRKTLLFDGDLGLANIDVQLGLAPGHDLGSVIAGRVALKNAVTAYQPGAAGGEAAQASFDILAGKSGSGVLSALSRAELMGLRQGIKALATLYQAVVIDLAAGLDTAVMTLADNGGTTLVIVNDEPTSMTDAYAFIKLLSMHSPGTDIRIIVNTAATKEHAQRTYTALATACQNFLDISPPFAGFIPRDDQVPDTIRHQAPLLFRHPQSRAGEAVRAIAKKLLLHPAQTPKTAPKAALGEKHNS